MPRSALDIPVFDADNHLYETEEALTKFLPDRYKGAIDYVEVRGRKKIVIRGKISEYIPNPTFEVVARPGAQEDYFRHGILEDPVTIFKRNIHISPFWEEDLGALADLIGVDRVLFGSDYPHPEGLADPASYADELAGQPDETVRKIMGGNLGRLMNVEDSVVR
jgi:hypothetical protein